MTNRIAEFDDSDDAYRFMKMKGPDYTVCAGVHRMWAVRPKDSYETGLGDPSSPPERVNRPYRDEDYD